MSDTELQKNTYALVVGIEQYEALILPHLNGQASDAHKFAAWLQARGVLRDHILLFLSPVEANKALSGPPEAPVPAATRANIYDALTKTLLPLRGSLLFIFWAGHGVITADGTRKLFYADGSAKDMRCLDLTALLTALRSDVYSFKRQVALVDACANYVEELSLPVTLPADVVPTGAPLTDREQFVLMGAQAGQRAKSDAVRRTGYFAAAVLERLQQAPAAPWLPDMKMLAEQLAAYFDDLRGQGKSNQAPAFFHYRNWNGDQVSIGQPGVGQADFLFMPPDLPDGFTQRPDELQKIKDLLLEADPAHPGEKRLQPGVVGLHGFGGFGKTTLALATCHDEEVRQACFTDGILWTELGRDPSETDLLQLISEWVGTLTGPKPIFTTRTAAMHSLRLALAERQMLLVIDDVWNEADVEPFLQGGPRCTRLLTTRETRTLPQSARLLDIGSMDIRDARQLLGAGLPQGYEAQLTQLAERLGCWSILLRLAKANLRQRVLRENQQMRAALVDILQELIAKGLTAFDPSNPKDRQQAVTATVEISLARLDEVKRQRYAELGVFPEDVSIPLDVLARLWKKTGNLSKSGTKNLCSELYQLSLLLAFDHDASMIRLHDVLRDYVHRKLPNRAGVHLALVDLWGERPKPQDAYGWRWVAYHLYNAALTSAQPATHDLATHVVQLVGDSDFQSSHKAVVKDLSALQSALGWAVRAAVADKSPEGLPLLATAARQVVRFRRKELRPESLFLLAGEGRVEEAERQSGLFDLDQNWRHALLLAIAWLGAGKNKGKARELRERVEGEMEHEQTLQRLLHWVDVDLLGVAQPVYQHHWHPSPELIRNILNRIGGGQVDAELLHRYGLDARNPNPSFITSRAKRGTTTYLVDLDGPFLVAHAADDQQKGAEVFDEYLSVFTNYNYPEYRFRSLWILLGYALQHPSKEWVRKTAQKVFVSALGGGSVEFEDALPAAVLALQARMGDAAMTGFLVERSRRLRQEADTIKIGRGGDSWGFHKRHMLALAQAFACLHIAELEIGLLLEQTEAIEESGFAGYQAPTNVAFAETVRICHLSDEAYWVERALGFAQVAAHNIQDPTFCARITARVNAMRRNWYGDFDLDEMAQGLGETPQARDFAALHYVKHEYAKRKPDSLPFLDWMKNACTLTDLARMFDRPEEAFMSLNREQGWSKTKKLAKGTPVCVPDPGFVPHLATRLAAEALINPDLDPDERIDLIRSLVPTALPSPTALDTVLARLALAWGMGYPEAITRPLVAALRQEAPLSDVRHPVPPIGELIG
jgi:hypothetical protein